MYLVPAAALKDQYEPVPCPLLATIALPVAQSPDIVTTKEDVVPPAVPSGVFDPEGMK